MAIDAFFKKKSIGESIKKLRGIKGEKEQRKFEQEALVPEKLSAVNVSAKLDTALINSVELVFRDKELMKKFISIVTVYSWPNPSIIVDSTEFLIEAIEAKYKNKKKGKKHGKR